VFSEAEIIVKDNPTHLAQTGAELFTSVAQASVQERGRFTVAVSGGSTPRLMHRLLAEEPYCSKTPWGKTSLFWVDERCVPVTDDGNNYGAARSDLLERVPLPTAQIYPMPVEMPPDEGAVEYQKVIQNSFQLGEGQFPIFDLIFLGIGADGHTASLFPGQSSIEEKKRLVIAVKGGIPNVSRLTMTYPTLNQARQLVILVSGTGKAAVLKTLFEDKQARLPAGRINPTNGTLTWLVDRDAAEALPKEETYGGS
jgi:6-phosphogluconolactonase